MPQLEIVPTLTCTVCEQLIDFERQQLDTSEVVLFGCERYAWCVECGQQVGQPWSGDYKRRWIRAARVSRRMPVGRLWTLRTAWRSGLDACRRGDGPSACDLPVGAERQAWLAGYLWACVAQPGAEADSAFRRWLRSREQMKAVRATTTGN